MKLISRLKFVILSLMLFGLTKAQVVTKQIEVPGTPCASCYANNTNYKPDPNSIMNGNGTNQTSYTTTACGLNYTYGSVRLGKRGSIAGVTQPAPITIAGIPPCFTVLKAFLYADASGNGVAVTATVKNPLAVSAAYPMTIIGTHIDKCWSSAGYSATYSYRADITAAISGNGVYNISGLPVGATNDVDGASIVIIYTDPTQMYTGSIVIGDGCHVAQGGTLTENLTGWSACSNSTFANAFMIIGDLQKIQNTLLNMNSAASNNTQLLGNDDWWNLIPGVSPMVTSGQNNTTFAANNTGDCYNIVACGLYYRTNCLVCANSNLTITPVTTGSCSAGSATANVTGGTGPYSYTWSPTGGNAQSVSGVPTGVYTVTVKDATGCKTGTATVNITAASGPTLTPTSGTMCAGSSATLTVSGVSGPITYTWTGPSLSTTSGSVTVASPASTTTYSVSGTNSVGCVATVTAQVVVNPIPVPLIGSNSPVCVGNPINLTSGGGTSYSWSGPSAFSSALQNPIIPSSTTANAGTYTVTVTSLGCSATNTVNVVISTPTTNATNTGPYCAGQTIQLNAPAATSYTWSGPGAFASNAQNPTRPASTVAMSGTYSVVVTIGTCTAMATTSVTVNALPTPTASNTGPYCAGQTIQLNTGSATTYSWSGPSAFTSNIQNPTQGSSTAAMGGVYTVTVSNVAGCINTASTTVVINPIPVPIANSNSPVCLNNTINLTSSGGTTYSWSGPSGFTSALQNPNIPSATTTQAGVYTVTVTSLGCSNSATVNVIVTTPTTSATNTGPYCAGQTIQLNAPAATSYTWSGPAAFASNAQNPTRPASTVPMSGTYTVLVTIGTCTATATTPVTVNLLPVPTASNTGPYCPGNTIQLIGSASTSYTWSGPSAYNSNVQSPTIASASVTNSGTYSITVTDVNGCKNTATTNVVVNPNPTPIINSNSPVCLNNTINLTSGGGTSYSWIGPNAFASAVQNPNIPNATTINAGVYTVTVTALGCSSTATTNVIVTTPTTSATNTGPYCAGQTIQLNAPAATSYTWSGPAAFASNAQNPTRPASTVPMSGTYTVLVTIGTCTATATTTVVVNALPTPTASNTGPYCPGNTIQLNGFAAVSYTWNGPGAYTSNSQSPTIGSAAVTNSGTYTITVADANGCKNTATTNVVVNPNPTPIINSNSPVCLNNTINLTSGGGTAYSWSGPNAFASAVQNPNIPSATTINAGVYTVTVTALGCSSTATTNVIVSTPTTQATNTGPYCAGTNIQLNAQAASSYTWTGPGGYTSNAQNPVRPASTVPMSGTYTVLVTIGTCTATATTTITVNALPTPTVNSNSPVCVGQPLNLMGSTAVTYNWSGPGGFTSGVQNPNIPVVASTNAGTYSLIVTDANGCSNVASTNVIINPLPIINTNSPTACINSAINLTSSGGTGYSWTGPGGFTSTSQNPNIPSASIGNAGQYTVVVTSAAGCTNTAVTNVAVLPLPTPAIVSNTPCVGSTLNLSGSGGATYSWNGPNSFSSNTQNPNINNVSGLANGTYTLTAISGTCTASTTSVITINPLPTPVMNISSPVCVGQPVNFTGNGGASYAWAGPGGFASTTQNGNVPVSTMGMAGNYSLTVTDANGCVKSTSQNLIINPLPNVTATGTTACENANANLSASGGVSYSWSGPGGYASNSQNAMVNSLTPSSAGQYTVLVTNANSCTNTAMCNLMVTPAPIPNIQTNSPICVNNVMSLMGSGGISYAWTGPNGFMSTAQSGTIMANTTSYSGTYYLTVTDAIGCFATTSATAVVNPNPNVNITTNGKAACAPSCMTFSAVSSSTNATYSWILGNGQSGGGDVQEVCYQTVGVYTISTSMIDANGCPGSATYTIQVYPKPVADFNYDPIKPIESVDMVSFTDASYNATITGWNWYFMSNAQYTSNMQNPTFLYTDAGPYPITLVVTSDKGCKDTIVISILVGEDFGIYVPNAFTPNADGLNDIFYAKGYGITKFEMQVFDRWGEKVFTSSNINDAWDGSYMKRGEKTVEEGTYTWRIALTNVFGKSKELTGHVTLIK